MVASWILVGVFLFPQVDGSTIQAVQPAKSGFATEKECNDYKVTQVARLDEFIAAGELVGYVIECRKVELPEPKAAAKPVPVVPETKAPTKAK